MVRMIAEVYDALRSAGADEDKARAAATAMAGQWDVEPRFDQIDRRFDQIAIRIDKIEQRLDRLENRFDRLEQRVSKIEADVAVLGEAHRIPIVHRDERLQHVAFGRVTHIEEGDDGVVTAGEC